YHTDLETEREKLIGLLIEYRRRKGHDITVVFDGWKSGGAKENASVRGGVKIVYSGLGERADSVIKRIISSDRREWVVISSDREIVSHAWGKGSTPLRSEEFLPFLEDEVMGLEAGPYITGSEKDEDEVEYYECRKGNPRQLSRKERAMKRALGRL
ncbi:MAG TPA: NYN domain-containing protein, partial [Thermodesulfovibrionales bacterium]|nr:NYN domain-containing protein [Thermodesulfovibrionales bacterium]